MKTHADKMRYLVYEGTPGSLDEGDRFSTLDEARKRAKFNVEHATTQGIQWVAHVLDKRNGDFVFSLSNELN